VAPPVGEAAAVAARGISGNGDGPRPLDSSGVACQGPSGKQREAVKPASNDP